MKTKLLFIIILSAFITACAGSPVHLSFLSPEALQSQSNKRLCNAYANMKKEKFRKEIERRNIITEEEWQLIDRKKNKDRHE